MKTRAKIIEEALQPIINKALSEQEQEMIIKGYRQAIKDVESLSDEPFDDMIADLYENLERLKKTKPNKN